MSSTSRFARVFPVLSVLSLVAVFQACAVNRIASAPSAPSVGQAPIITVTNQNAQDMKVYLVLGTGESRRRLGTVPAYSSAAFILRQQLWGPSRRLVLQPFANPQEEFVTEEFATEPGRLVDVRVASTLKASIVFQR